MKVKCDFVTNSSSTSYCMYGKSFDKEELKGLLGLGEDEDEYPADTLYEIDKGLEVQEMDDDIIVGVSPYEMTDDQTLREFKEYVVSRLNNVGLKVGYSDIELIFGEYYDG